MKVIRIHGPTDTRYEEIPQPKATPNHVLVKVKAVAIFATDVELDTESRKTNQQRQTDYGLQ
jgi:NADPH:quinone reductase-like Zn-dependent oxidoreductase